MDKNQVKNAIEKAVGMMFLDGVLTTDDHFAIQRICTSLNINNIDEIRQFVRVTFVGSNTTTFTLL
jgi:hypothetical protein